MDTLQFTVQPCWLGHALIAATDIGICAIALGDSPEMLIADLKHNFPSTSPCPGGPEFIEAIQPVLTFIDNPQTNFPAPLDPKGTDFQRQVWRELQAIAPGTTLTYTELAERLGNPQSVRAVANACAKNKIAIAIPCHRIIGSDGSLRGYRWGENRKRRLLEKESGIIQRSLL
ncbi:MAG: methylated-DNA--[protein]-cysteine S-methyltransferase [Cyanobacteria bacterium P01_H01_bin.130]